MDRLFLDANILFSAAYRPAAGLTRLWQLEHVQLLTSAYAVGEDRVNLTEADQRRRLEKLLRRVSIVTGATPASAALNLPQKDLPILQAALYARATHLLTGDRRHFGTYYGRRIDGVLVLPPARYLRQFEL